MDDGRKEEEEKRTKEVTSSDHGYACRKSNTFCPKGSNLQTPSTEPGDSEVTSSASQTQI